MSEQALSAWRTFIKQPLVRNCCFKARHEAFSRLPQDEFDRDQEVASEAFR